MRTGLVNSVKWCRFDKKVRAVNKHSPELQEASGDIGGRAPPAAGAAAGQGMMGVDSAHFATL